MSVPSVVARFFDIVGETRKVPPRGLIHAYVATASVIAGPMP